MQRVNTKRQITEVTDTDSFRSDTQETERCNSKVPKPAPPFVMNEMEFQKVTFEQFQKKQEKRSNNYNFPVNKQIRL